MKPMDLDNNDVKSKIHRSIDKLLRYDDHLLRYDVNERSISHQLAIYIQDNFPEWNVDCEYNRHLNEIKRLNLQLEQLESNDTNAKTVFPDIIVHHRGKDDNLLVIEIKKSTNPQTSEYDCQKLIAFKSELGYQIALFIKFRVGIENFGVEEERWL
ncbi:MAG: hypothetical protein ABSA51_03170 [Anaerolineaceae bacterium]|jgi:hypothetical protein